MRAISMKFWMFENSTRKYIKSKLGHTVNYTMPNVIRIRCSRFCNVHVILTELWIIKIRCAQIL